MARTFIRQESQIRPSFTYVDNVAPSATMESGAASIEDDLNNLRSIASLLRDVQTGNWYDDLAAPVTFEGGIKRGVQNLNQELHDLERKRVLVEVFDLADIRVGVSAIGTLTATADFANGETVTIGTKTYTFQTVLTNVDGNVLIGGSASASLDNLIAAIVLGAGSGTLYAAATTLHPTVRAEAGAGDTMLAIAKAGGTGGNAIATTDVATNASWGGATLAGGLDNTVLILDTAAKLPANTTAAIGSVTTRGTVAAAHGGVFGAHSLSLVSGSNPLNPKNLVPLVDSVTHDPVLSGQRRVWGLFQTESSTDGSTITTATPNRAQVSLVRQNGAGTALEAVPFADVSSMTLHYSAIERKALEDLNEQDFLKGSTVDVAAGSTVTRQIGYDNQGTVPVEQTTDAFLDLAAGFKWSLRDLLNAELFTVREGSGGATSEVQIRGDVDVFRAEALVNDFNAGINVRTGGTRPIRVGVNDGLIETTAGDLGVSAFAELLLDDGNQAGSSWAQTTGVKLSDTSAEWSDVETAFGGEFSILRMLYLAKTTGTETKTYHNVTANVNEDLDISLAAGNIDVAFPDMSAGSFLNDYDVFLNGELLRPGANSGANNDYYPGSTLTPAAALRFEFKLKSGDVICVVKKTA
jgi:hypothetical protein